MMAEALPTDLELDVPAPISFEQADEASAGYPGLRTLAEIDAGRLALAGYSFGAGRCGRPGTAAG